MASRATLPSLLGIFSSLDQIERHTFLNELSRQFRPSDWWYLQGIFATRTIYRDIVGTLPIEISVQILEYLEPVDSIRLRFVSKRWNYLLCSEVVCGALVNRWYPIDLKLHLQGKPWRWILENAASRDQKILKINCDTEERLFVQPEPDVPFTQNLKYDPAFDPYQSFLEGQAAYIDFSADRGGRFLCVIDLTKEPVEPVVELAAPSRVALSGVYLMKEYVMATTGDTTRAYVWNIKTQECKTIRLPNTNVLRFVADGNIFVATIYKEDKAILYNAIDNRTISVGQGMCSGDVQTKVNILDEKKKLLTMVHRDDRECCIVQTYSTCNGELIKTETFKLPHRIIRPLHVNLRCGEHDFIVFMNVVWPPKDDPRFKKDRGFFSTREGLCTHALIFNRQKGCFLHQRLWFKDLSDLPQILHMYQGVVHARGLSGWSLYTGLNVPMCTSESFFPLSTQKLCLEVYEHMAIHTISPGRIVYKRTEGTDDWATWVQVYRGNRENEENGDGEETV
ncbi:hypothetical protein K440DRAFT_141543 [Wilcoxina mikolae CBS 423.85]|nr:hypothetical protein K440DRAFT_141543 [Wilcoxina mikolae CBS 423.85]